MIHSPSHSGAGSSERRHNGRHGGGGDATQGRRAQVRMSGFTHAGQNGSFTRTCRDLWSRRKLCDFTGTISPACKLTSNPWATPRAPAHMHTKVTAHHIGLHPCEAVWQRGMCRCIYTEVHVCYNDRGWVPSPNVHWYVCGMS